MLCVYDGSIDFDGVDMDLVGFYFFMIFYLLRGSIFSFFLFIFMTPTTLHCA